MLQIENIDKTFQADNSIVKALNGVSLDVEAGSFLSIQGPSGCGKSTLLLTCAGLLAPDKGTVCLNTENIYSLKPNKRANFRAQHIGIVFQQFHLLPYLNVSENILSASLPLKPSDTNKRCDELIELFNLKDRVNHRPNQLSVGEKQRVALARAVFHKPQLILADEPTGNLDESNAHVVLDYLRSFTQDNASVIMVTHDAQAAKQADKNIHMDNGQII